MRRINTKTKCRFALTLITLLSISMMSGCTTKEKNKSESSKQAEVKSDTELNDDVSVNEEIDLSSFFNGINGCAVLLDSEDNKYSFYNQSLCEQKTSPYSTFKIVSTLAGLQNGVLENSASTMSYNGTQYSIPDWNGNLTLKEAFQSSCIWYFRQVIDAVGENEVANELNTLSYGNCDVSQWNGSGINPQEELNGFWLDSSLRISPLEQVDVLSKIFEGNSIYSDEHVAMLKDIMLVDDSGKQKVYGKTGSGSNGQACFVGFAEKNESREYFAIYLDDAAQKENISGSTVKEIALNICNSKIKE